MTQRECEDRLLALAAEAERVYLEYCPEGTHLSIFASRGRMSIMDGMSGKIHVVKNGGWMCRSDEWEKRYKEAAKHDGEPV